MAARIKRVRGPDPWAERFEFEAKKHTQHPFPHTRKGAPIKPVRRMSHGVRDLDEARAKVRGLIWK